MMMMSCTTATLSTSCQALTVDVIMGWLLQAATPSLGSSQTREELQGPRASLELSSYPATKYQVFLDLSLACWLWAAPSLHHTRTFSGCRLAVMTSQGTFSWLHPGQLVIAGFIWR